MPAHIIAWHGTPPPPAAADGCVACAVTTRAKEFGSQLDIPGPGSYDNATDQKASGYLGDAPCYSMGARKAVPKPDDTSPGPVYSPRVLTPGSTGLSAMLRSIPLARLRGLSRARPRTQADVLPYYFSVNCHSTSKTYSSFSCRVKFLLGARQRARATHLRGRAARGPRSAAGL